MNEVEPTVETLSIEVGSVKQDIRDLTHNVNGLITAMRASAEQFSNLRERVGVVEKSVTDMAGSVKDLVKEMKEDNAKRVQAAKTPWGTILTFVGITYTIGAGIGWLVLQPINTSIARIERDAQDIVPRQEHLQRWQQGSDNIARLQGAIDRSFDQLNRRLERLEDRSRPQTK